MEGLNRRSTSIYSFLVLYTLQGLPYGLQSSFLPLYFRTHGMSLAHIGFFKLLLIPWVLKFLWAPAVDSMEETKHYWIKSSLLILASLCLFASSISPDNSIALIVILFMCNAIISVQDIAVDALLIEVSTHSQLVLGNTLQVVGSKAGSLITGGVYLWYIDTLSWAEIFYSLAFFYFLGLLVSLFYIHPPAEVIEPSPSPSSVFENEPNIGIVKSSHRKAQRYLKRIFETKGTSWIMRLLLFYKLGESGFNNLFPLFLVDNGIPAETVGFYTGVLSLAISMIGSTFGGILFASSSMKNALKVYMFGLVSTQASILLSVLFWNGTNHSYWTSGLLYAISSFFSGAITTCTFTLAMQISQKAPRNYQASHYTLLATVEVLGKLFFASIVGLIADFSGYSVAFIVFFSLTLFNLPILFEETNVCY